MTELAQGKRIDWWKLIEDLRRSGLSMGGIAAGTFIPKSTLLGYRNLEKRVIRDKCLPAHDRACVAAQLRAMKRLWPDVPGLQGRRESEARLAEGRA